MKTDLRKSLAVLLVAALAGCPKAENSTPSELSVSGGGAGLLFSVGGIRRHEAMTALATMVRKRLEAFGVRGAEVDVVLPGGVRVLVAGAGEDGARRIEQLVTRPVSIAITPVDPGRAFFESLRDRLPRDASLRVGVDQVGDLKHAKTVRIWYLASSDRTGLERFLDGLEPPAGRRLAVMTGSGGAMALLLPDPPAIQNPVLTRVRVIADEAGGRVSVGAELARPFRDPFDDLVRSNLHRPLAFVVDGEVRALPVVASRSQRGEIRIDPSPLAPEQDLRQQAERLAVMLKAWQLVGEFELVEKKITPAR